MSGRIGVKDFFIRVVDQIRSNTILCLAIFIYVIVFSILMISRHYTFLTSGFDLGIFNQAFWTTLFENRLFYETGDLSFNPRGLLFGTHFSPILLLLLPFYAIHPGVETLMVIQSTVLALGAVPVYWMTRDHFRKDIATALAVLYLAYPPLHYLTIDAFHLEALLPTFFLFTIYYLEKECWKRYFFFLWLSMLTIEFAPIITFFIGLYGLVLWKRKVFKNSKYALKYMVLTLIFSVLIFLLALESKAYFNPYVSPVPSTFELHSPPDTISTIVFQWYRKLYYWLCFFAPFLFLPFLSPELLIMIVPWMGASSMSRAELYYSIYYHYNGFVIPFIFVALLKSLRKITTVPNSINLRSMKKVLSLLFVSMLIFGLFLPFGPFTPWSYQLPIATERAELLRRVLALVPPNGSILTQNDIFPHVSNRVEAYMYFPSFRNVCVEYILVDISSIWYKWVPGIGGEKIPPSVIVADALASKEYGILASARGILLLKKGYNGSPVIFLPITTMYNYEHLKLKNGEVIEDFSSDSGLVLHHRKEDPEGTFWNGPYVDLPPGRYKVTLKLRIDPPAEGILLELNVTVKAGLRNICSFIVHSGDFESLEEWQEFAFYFELKALEQSVEFKGTQVKEGVSIYLDRMLLEQVDIGWTG